MEFEARQCEVCGEISAVEEWFEVAYDEGDHPLGDDAALCCPCCNEPIM